VPRIIVTTDLPTGAGAPAILLDELVNSVHLSTRHASEQLVERLAWAIVDAEQAETERVTGRTAARERARRRAADISTDRSRRLAA